MNEVSTNIPARNARIILFIRRFYIFKNYIPHFLRNQSHAILFTLSFISLHQIPYLKSKALPYVVLIVLAVAVLIIRQCRSGGLISADRSKNSSNREVNRNRGFDRRTSFIEYTAHAKCRMGCRQISTSEVEEIMRDGNINYRKSDPDARPCPTYAVEGMTHDNQHVRIVFAQCDYKTKVVTTIDLDHEWECHCPGDDKKFSNN